MKTTILVVEDNVLNRQLVRDLLELRGHVVVEAATVEAGREMLRACSPDLILLDIQIPGGGGGLLLREVRADRRIAKRPVVAMTAYAMQGDRERFLKAGFDGYLSKPLDIRTFAEEIEGYLRKKGAQDVR